LDLADPSACALVGRCGRRGTTADGDAVDAFIAEPAQKYGGKKSLQTKEAQTEMSASFGRKN
jgi:hypothetical protein